MHPSSRWPLKIVDCHLRCRYGLNPAEGNEKEEEERFLRDHLTQQQEALHREENHSTRKSVFSFKYRSSLIISRTFLHET